MFVENTATWLASTMLLTLKIGSPRCRPSFFESGVSATMQPSLLLRTTTGLFFNPEWKIFSTEQKNELQSISAHILPLKKKKLIVHRSVNDKRDSAPDRKVIILRDSNLREVWICWHQPPLIATLDETLQRVVTIKLTHSNLMF